MGGKGEGERGKKEKKERREGGRREKKAGRDFSGEPSR